MTTVKLSEKFVSIQGEGRALGWPMAFVRLTHCNIDCSWCDTPQRKVGDKVDIDELSAWILGCGVKRVCLTGGEPMLQLGKLEPLIRRLHHYADIQWHMETNGTFDPREFASVLDLFECVTVSPKLPSAQNPDPKNALERKPVFLPAMFDLWVKRVRERENTYFKFVVADDDWKHLEAVLGLIPRTDDAPVEIHLQPQTYEGAHYARFGEKILDHLSRGWPPGRDDLNVRYMPRFHDIMWGDAPGR